MDSKNTLLAEAILDSSKFKKLKNTKTEESLEVYKAKILIYQTCHT